MNFNPTIITQGIFFFLHQFSPGGESHLMMITLQSSTERSRDDEAATLHLQQSVRGGIHSIQPRVVGALHILLGLYRYPQHH
ncbi:hypothetical protein MA16_Dca003887 [Dendrobium catenatum]|uniref:Uncharacterized protein n=1 Tax=Dendrobium catenatum TaxID=906689 RepID=A0A2I0X1U1_9ASPA|nr:hypothetical protein MA16_Dca003887 [Dendrobium catenatum]